MTCADTYPHRPHFVLGDRCPGAAPQPDTASHTDDPATHDPRCVSVSRWHVGECYLPQPDTASLPEVSATGWYRQGYEAGRKAQPDTDLTVDSKDAEHRIAKILHPFVCGTADQSPPECLIRARAALAATEGE